MKLTGNGIRFEYSESWDNQYLYISASYLLPGNDGSELMSAAGFVLHRDNVGAIGCVKEHVKDILREAILIQLPGN